MTRIRLQRWLAGTVIVLAGVLAYWNSFPGVFLFDDHESILGNPTIRDGTGWADWIHPPSHGQTVSGRPALNVSFALNRRWSGNRRWSYHLINLLIHLIAGLALWGIARRTLERVEPFRLRATLLASVVALWWIVHPLQTESVTYLVQRAESLMGLCYLGTLWLFLRGSEASEQRFRGAAFLWSLASVLVCALGMFSKEVMVSAPLIVLLYDRTFISGSFAAAWANRRGYWIALMATWLALAAALMEGGNRGGTAGFGTKVNIGQYWLSQGPAILRYLRLTFWPSSLVLDYGFEKNWILYPGTAVPAALMIGGLAGSALVLLWRAPRWGFLGFVFFSILAPTSLVPGNRQTLAEHRMYLALAPVLILVVIGLWLGVRRWRFAGAIMVLVAIVVAGGLGWRTHRRNGDYASELGMWLLTLSQVPDNVHAHTNVGTTYYLSGRIPAAAEEFAQAASLDPLSAAAQSNWGLTFYKQRQTTEAEAHFRRAIELDPHFATAPNNLGALFAAENRWELAREQYRKALEIEPIYPDAEANLGVACRELGQLNEAERHLRQSLRLDPDRVGTHFDLAITLQRAGKLDPADMEYALAYSQAPSSPELQFSWGKLSVTQQRWSDAIEHFSAAIGLRHDYAEAWLNRGVVLAQIGKLNEAVSDYHQAILANHDYPEAWTDLGNAQMLLKRTDAAIDSLRTAVQLAPAMPEVHFNLGVALSAAQQKDAAIKEFLEAVRLRPGLVEARNNLATVYAARGQMAEAIAQLTQIIALRPDYLQAHQNLALIYRAIGRMPEAQREELYVAQLRRK